jgi:hypothetical protein
MLFFPPVFSEKWQQQTSPHPKKCPHFCILPENVEQGLHAHDAAADRSLTFEQNWQRYEFLARNKVQLEHNELQQLEELLLYNTQTKHQNLHHTGPLNTVGPQQMSTSQSIISHICHPLLNTIIHIHCWFSYLMFPAESFWSFVTPRWEVLKSVLCQFCILLSLVLQ